MTICCIFLYIILGLLIVALVAWYINQQQKQKQTTALKIGDTVQYFYNSNLPLFAIVPADKAPYPMAAQGTVCSINNHNNIAIVQWNTTWNRRYPEVTWWREKESQDWVKQYLGAKCQNAAQDPSVNKALSVSLLSDDLIKPQVPIRP